MNIRRVYELLIRGFRRRRMQRFMATFQPTAQTTLLDVGGTPFNWELIGAAFPITLLNTEPIADSSLGGRFTRVRGSGTRLDFPDQSFDIAFSNSVIEHVGSLDAQRAFAKELRRVGCQLWVQTPARGFFFEPHLLAPFIHYLPLAWQRRLARNFTLWGWLTRPSREAVDRMLGGLRLLDHATFRELFPDCEIRRERFLGFTKAFVAVRVEALRAAR
ncbi:MAG TPA: class I SAM-dependent methyltransferase [Myxococcota bacterium]|nr:class I SAM-dependent methyltransferase [Myxococcota bacterium]